MKKYKIVQSLKATQKVDQLYSNNNIFTNF